jgi:integrase
MWITTHFSKAKRDLDQKLGDVPSWVLHDLQRSARSLMSRAGVRPDIAERALGHAIAGVEGVYDRHVYSDEKADALNRLAGLGDVSNPSCCGLNAASAAAPRCRSAD